MDRWNAEVGVWWKVAPDRTRRGVREVRLRFWSGGIGGAEGR